MSTIDGQQFVYTEVQAAEFLGIKPRQLRDMRYRGRINYTKIGTRVRFTRDQLMAFLDANAAGGDR